MPDRVTAGRLKTHRQNLELAGGPHKLLKVSLMKTAITKTESQKLASNLEMARLRVETAESRREETKEQARVARRKRKEMKVIARRAKQEAKKAKAELGEAREALAQAEAEIAKSAAGVATVGQGQPAASGPPGAAGPGAQVAIRLVPKKDIPPD